MGLLENARYASIERGYDYYKRGNVISFKQTSENEYEGKVSGSAKKPRNITKVSKAIMNPSLTMIMTMIMTMIILMKMMNLTKISERLSAIF